MFVLIYQTWAKLVAAVLPVQENMAQVCRYLFVLIINVLFNRSVLMWRLAMVVTMIVSALPTDVQEKYLMTMVIIVASAVDH